MYNELTLGNLFPMAAIAENVIDDRMNKVKKMHLIQTLILKNKRQCCYCIEKKGL